MPRRAGLIEAPTGTVQTPNLGSGAAHPATLQVYDDLAKAARSVGDLVQPAIDANTEKEARAAVAKGQYATTSGLTRQDQIYDKIVDAGYMAQASMDVDRMVGELENKHLSTLNMEEFGKDNDAARTLYLENADERHAPALAIAWDQRALNATQRLSGIATQKAIKQASDRLTSRASQLADEVSGASDPGEFTVAWRLAELKQIQGARVAVGDITKEEADAGMAVVFGRITAHRVNDEVSADYVASGYSDEGYTAALEKADKALSAPQLALSRSERDTFLLQAKNALNGMRSEVKMREREIAAQIKEAQTEALSAFTSEMSDVKALAAEGFVNFEKLNELARLAHQTSKPEALLKQIADVGRIGVAQQQMRTMSIPDQEQHVQKLQQAAASGDLAAAKLLGPVRKVATASRQAAEDDPATFSALRENRDVPVIDWSTPDRAMDTMASRFQQAEMAAGDLGVAPKYFSPADRAAAKAKNDKGGVEALQMVTAIVRSAEAADVDPLRVLEEVGGGGAPLLATAGALIAQGAPVDVARKILINKDWMGSELVKGNMPSQYTQKKVQQSVLGPMLATMPPPVRDAITRSADAYYVTELMENQGAPKDSTEKAYERATRAVMGEWQDDSGKTWGGKTKIRDAEVAVPPWIRKSDFPSLVAGLTKDEILRSAAGSQLYSTMGTYDGRQATVADYRSAKLIQVAAGRYAIAPDPARGNKLVLGFNGQPMVLDLNLIREDLKQRSSGVK